MCVGVGIKVKKIRKMMVHSTAEYSGVQHFGLVTSIVSVRYSLSLSLPPQSLFNAEAMAATSTNFLNMYGV